MAASSDWATDLLFGIPDVLGYVLDSSNRNVEASAVSNPSRPVRPIERIGAEIPGQYRTCENMGME